MKFKGLYSHEYAKSWDTAFPVGNGTIGGLVFGDPVNEKIVTNHEELYIPMPANSDLRPFLGAHLVPELRRLILEGKYKEASEYYEKGLGEDGYPVGGMIWTNPFETCTDLFLEFEALGSIENYERKLDFTSGECTVSFNHNSDRMVRKCFVSRSRNVLVMSISQNEMPFNFCVRAGENSEIHDMESVTHYIEDGMVISEGVHSEEESGYVSALRVVTDGITSEKYYEDGDAGIYVRNAKNVLLLYTLAPWKKNVVASKVKLQRILKDILLDYSELLREHESIHGELFSRVKTEFSQSDSEYTNEELRDLCTEDSLCPELLERMTDFGRYLLISSFGKLPPNLQGVWNGSANPPWSSDYTLDENIQMMMWQVLPGDLPEMARNYFDWLESYTEDFKKNAKSYYGCRGVFAAARVALNGVHRHFGQPWPMFFWTAGAGWLSSVYEDYYEYTGDLNILLRGVKYWKEVVLFYEDFLIEDENHKFMFVPSYSPENTPLGNDSPTAINATMDVAIAKEVYRNLINACKILDIEKENLPVWEKEYEKFPEYTVNEDGALKEWIPEDLKDDYHHRHSSHLYPVFPGREAKEDGKDDLFKACHRACELRLLDGVDAISGWGLAHLANISARLNDDKLWYMALNRLIQKFTLDNLFTGHNEHSLFQMDANLGITAAVYEAFAYSDMKKTVLFPVNSDKFDNVRIEGLKTRGRLHIRKLEKANGEIRGEFYNQGKNSITVILPDDYFTEAQKKAIIVAPGEKVTLRAYYKK